MGGRGRGWGRRGTAPRPATGRRRAHFHRGGAPRPAPGRLGRPAGKVARGGPAVAAAGPPRPECYSPPAAALAESRGRGSPDLSPRSPPSRRFPPPGGRFPRGGRVPRGGAPVSGGAGPPLPRRDRSPTPARPPSGGGSGRGGLSPVRPGRVAPSGPGGREEKEAFLFLGHAGRRSERTGSAAMSATHPTRLETRTKESNTCASQGLARKPPWRNEGEGRPRRRPRWDPEASPVRRGRTTGPSRPPRRGGGA